MLNFVQPVQVRYSTGMNRPLLQLPRLTSRLALKLPHLSLRRSLNTQVITETTRTVAGANIPPLPLSAPIDAVSASPISELALAGLGSSYTPVGWIQLLLDQIHTTAEMPWIPTIVVATLVLRLLLLPLTLKGQRAAAKLASIQHLVKPLNDEMQRLKKNGDTQGASLQAGKLRTLFVEHKVNPLAGLVQILQIPVLISAFLGVKSMAENLPSFSDPAAGMGWITNLSVADPTGVLPVVGSLGMLAGIELSTRLAPQAGVAAGGGMIWVMRVMSIVSIPFMSYLPSVIVV